MLFDAVAAFEYMTNTFFGVGSPCQLLCSQNNINEHRKLRARLKNIRDLWYIDPITGTKAKLSDDDFYEISALQSVINKMQNHTGPIESCPIDITDFSRDDFLGPRIHASLICAYSASGILLLWSAWNVRLLGGIFCVLT